MKNKYYFIGLGLLVAGICIGVWGVSVVNKRVVASLNATKAMPNIGTAQGGDYNVKIEGKINSVPIAVPSTDPLYYFKKTRDSYRSTQPTSAWYGVDNGYWSCASDASAGVNCNFSKGTQALTPVNSGAYRVKIVGKVGGISIAVDPTDPLYYLKRARDYLQGSQPPSMTYRITNGYWSCTTTLSGGLSCVFKY